MIALEKYSLAKL